MPIQKVALNYFVSPGRKGFPSLLLSHPTKSGLINLLIIVQKQGNFKVRKSAAESETKGSSKSMDYSDWFILLAMLLLCYGLMALLFYLSYAFFTYDFKACFITMWCLLAVFVVAVGVTWWVTRRNILKKQKISELQKKQTQSQQIP